MEHKNVINEIIDNYIKVLQERQVLQRLRIEYAIKYQAESDRLDEKIRSLNQNIEAKKAELGLSGDDAETNQKVWKAYPLLFRLTVVLEQESKNLENKIEFKAAEGFVRIMNGAAIEKIYEEVDIELPPSWLLGLGPDCDYPDAPELSEDEKRKSKFWNGKEFDAVKYDRFIKIKFITSKSVKTTKRVLDWLTRVYQARITERFIQRAEEIVCHVCKFPLRKGRCKRCSFNDEHSVFFLRQ